MTDQEIENLIQKLYAWSEKRDVINSKRVDSGTNYRALSNDLIKNAIKCIQQQKMELDQLRAMPQGEEKLKEKPQPTTQRPRL
jgi:hypothetical protein